MSRMCKTSEQSREVTMFESETTYTVKLDSDLEATVKIVARSEDQGSLPTIVSRAKQAAKRMIDDGRAGADGAEWGTGSMHLQVTIPEE